MTEETKLLLKDLAEKYETSSFLNSDPSQFLRWYSQPCDVEVASFIAAMLSFGNRNQFIPKIKSIFLLADQFGCVSQWLLSGEYKKSFLNFADECGCDGNYEKKFYRFYSYNEMLVLFSRLAEILKTSPTFGDFVKQKLENEQNSKETDLGGVVSSCFPDCKIVPHGKDSANKRIYMFLRWMVRINSSVDLGLWNWYSPSDLIIPLDTHVIQESAKLGLIAKNAPANLKTAKLITSQLKEIWQNDPCKGDFALFGLGVDDES